MRRPWGAALVAGGLAGAALLLAFLYHLGVAAVAVAILATVPTVYLTWKALPATAREPPRSQSAMRRDPVDLGVHQVIGGGPMPTYIRRPHDELLRAVLDPAVPASRLVVVRGGSSTGKTRAAYEAVADRLADWRLDYPLNVAALAARLDAGVAVRTVLWLGDLRQYADADGGAEMLGRLADLLQGDGHLLITSVWPEQWSNYIGAARAGGGTFDLAGTVGRLLERLPELTGRDPAQIDSARGGVIDVPDRFTAAEMATAIATGDSVLAGAVAAAASAGQEGQVTQYLAGVPDLLRRYGGPGGDPYGQAVITAAMDATRLGHASPLPAALLQEAAVGYLTGPQRTKDIATWRDTALAWATAELNGAVRALQPVPPAAGTGVAGYRVADYLDQHARRTRRDQLGPPSLWEALTARAATASDLTRLGQAARDRGLYRQAAALWTTAVTLGSATAAGELIRHLGQVSPADTSRAARWAASQVSLDDPRAVAELLKRLRWAAAGHAARTLASRAAVQVSLDDPGGVAELLKELHGGAFSTLLARDPAARVSLDDPRAVAELLRVLRTAEDGEAARALAGRAAARVSLDDPWAVAELLKVLRRAGDGEAARALAGRAAAQVSLDMPRAVASLLEDLRGAGNGEAARTLASRAAAQANPDDLVELSWLVGELRRAGDNEAARTLARRAAVQASLDDPRAVAWLLQTLRGDDGAVCALMARDPAAQVTLHNPSAVAWLATVLRVEGNRLQREARDASHALSAASRVLAARATQANLGNQPGTRAAGQVSLDDPRAVAELLHKLRDAEDDGAVRTLVFRLAAAQVSLDNPFDVAYVLGVLRYAGADDAARTLAIRAAKQVSLNDLWAVQCLLQHEREAGASDTVAALAARAADAGGFDLFLKAHLDGVPGYPFGREPDGAPSQPWKWQKPATKRADSLEGKAK